MHQIVSSIPSSIASSLRCRWIRFKPIHLEKSESSWFWRSFCRPLQTTAVVVDPSVAPVVFPATAFPAAGGRFLMFSAAEMLGLVILARPAASNASAVALDGGVKVSAFLWFGAPLFFVVVELFVGPKFVTTPRSPFCRCCCCLCCCCGCCCLCCGCCCLCCCGCLCCCCCCCCLGGSRNDS